MLYNIYIAFYKIVNKIFKFMLKILSISLFLISTLAFSFDYEVETHAKRKVIKSFQISKNKKFISFTLEGTWTDNLGNYGLIEQASTVILNNDNVIELDGYGKTIYQNNQITYFRGYRNRQEKDSGVGQTIILHSTEDLSSLIGMKCPYAVKFFSNTAYVISKCKITEQQKLTLSKITQ